MEVYPRGDVFYFDCVDPRTGKRLRKSTGCTNERQAKKKAQELMFEMETEARQWDNGRKPVSLGETVDLYLNYLEAHQKPSAAGIRFQLEKTVGRNAGMAAAGKYHLDPRLVLHELTPEHMERLALARLKEGISRQTVKIEITYLRAAVRYVVGLRYRGPNDMLNGAVRNAWRLPEVSHKTRYLSWDEWQAVYAAMEPCRPDRDGAERSNHVEARQQALDLFVALTLVGGRLNEVRGLTWDRINTPECDAIRLYGKKTRTERMVPVPRQVQEVLQRRWAERKGDRVFPGDRSSDAVIRQAFEAAGINTPEKVRDLGKATIHSLRHTFASWLLQRGASLAEVQEALGHTTIDMTRRYAHLSQAPTMTKLASILEGVVDSTEGSNVVPLTHARMGL